MKVTLFAAMSLNSIIARDNGSEDFLSDLDWTTFKKLAEGKRGIIMGRKAYEIVKKWEGYNLDNFKCIKIIVSRKNPKLSKGYFLAKSPKSAIKIAKSKDLREIIIAGGGKLNGSFIKEKLVNEIIINIDPVLISKGITSLSDSFQDTRLKLIGLKRLLKNIVQLHYKVIK